MNKKSIIMLVFACVFVTVTAGLLAYDSFLSISAYSVLFGSHPENFGEALGSALGGVLLYALTIIFGAFILASVAATLPFDIILLKSNGKKWYSLAILIFSIVAAVLAIIYIAMLPVVSQIESAAKESASSSSSSIDSSSALLLL